MSLCQFCEEFERGTFEVRGQNLGNRILFETENFVVFPALGQIVEGYLIIASRKHYIGLGQIPSKLYPKLGSVQKIVRNVLNENYGAPLFFEHGPISNLKKGGCCIEHAHIHAVPVQVDLLSDLSKHFQCKEIDSYGDLKQQFKTGVPYFFLEDNSGKKYLFEVPNIVPSQYIRQVIAKKIGKPERWDWRTYFGLEDFVNTFKKLKSKFKVNSSDLISQI